MGIFDKIKDAVSSHPDEVKQGIDHAGDFIDSRTEGKYADKIDQGQDFLRGQVENLDGTPAESTERPGEATDRLDETAPEQR